MPALAETSPGRVEHSFDDPELAALASGVNQLVCSVQDGVNEAKTALTAIADANLTHRMDDRFQGIFLELGEQINVTVARLSQMVSSIRSASDISAQRSNQVSQSSDILARQAESQAASVEETSATMETITTVVRSSAERLTEAERLSKLVAEKTGAGAQSAERAVESVQLNRQSVGEDYPDQRRDRGDFVPNQPTGAECSRRSGARR